MNRALLKWYTVVWNDFRALILPLNDLQTSLCVAWTWRCPGMPRYSSTSFDFVTTFPTSYGGVCLACCGGWRSRQAGHPWTSSPQTWRLGATSSRRSSSSIFRNACESTEEKCLVLFASLKWFTIFFFFFPIYNKFTLLLPDKPMMYQCTNQHSTHWHYEFSWSVHTPSSVKPWYCNKMLTSCLEVLAGLCVNKVADVSLINLPRSTLGGLGC